jgi:hypothetical protein
MPVAFEQNCGSVLQFTEVARRVAGAEPDGGSVDVDVVLDVATGVAVAAAVVAGDTVGDAVGLGDGDSVGLTSGLNVENGVGIATPRSSSSRKRSVAPTPIPAPASAVMSTMINVFCIGCMSPSPPVHVVRPAASCCFA